MNVDVSPDGEALAFDLLGDIYWLPVKGGEARPITAGRAWDQAPRFSPDGQLLYFVSDREGARNIWRYVFDDRIVEKVTTFESDVIGTPNWSQNGTRLLAGVGNAKLMNAEVILQSIDPTSGDATPINKPEGSPVDWRTFKPLRPLTKAYSGVQTADGQVYFDEISFNEELNRRVVRLHRYDLDSQRRSPVTPLDATYSEYKPQLSHNGSLVAYFRQYDDRRTELRLLERSTGKSRVLIELPDADDAYYAATQDARPNYAFTPGDRKLIFWNGGKIHRVTLADGSSEVVPFRVNVVREVWERARPPAQSFDDIGEAQVIRWPTISRDGQRVAFAAIGYVWILDVETGGVRRLTNSADLEYMPAISPDGRSVAYISFTSLGDEYGPGRLLVADIASGTPRTLLTHMDTTYLLPNWSQDGSRIALIREVETADGTRADFGWTGSNNGSFSKVSRAPASNEFFSLPIYSRFVGFDESGRSLRFSFSISRTEVILKESDLATGLTTTLAVAGPEVGGITPSLDLTSLALNRRDGSLWLVPFDVDSESTAVSTLAPDARRISESSGYYVRWHGPNQVTYGFGQKIYRYSTGHDEAETLNVTVAFPREVPGHPIAFKGARLITMANDSGAGPIIESGTIVLDGMRITAVGRVNEVTIPAEALVVDATGDFIIPGLIDTHYHRIGGGGGTIGNSALKLPNPLFSDRSAIAYGITTAWEPGGPWDDGVPATADLQAAGRILGPRWSHSAAGGVGHPYRLLSTYRDAARAVWGDKALGVHVLKEYNATTRQQRQWLSIAAREAGMGIVSHIVSFDGMMTRVVDGYTGGDHPFIPVPFFKDVRELLKQTGFIWTPNIVITSGSSGGSNDTKGYFWQELIKKRPWEPQKLKSITPDAWINRKGNSQPRVPYPIHRVRRVAKQAASAAKAGIHIGVSAHSMPGARLHGEIWYLWTGGLSAEDVLRAATMGNAAKLGLQEEIGSLEQGKIADFLVLDENPLDDILNTLSLRYTVQGGVVYDSDTALPLVLGDLRESDGGRPMLP